MVTVTTHYTYANGDRVRIRGSLAAVLTTLGIIWRNAMPPEADMYQDVRFSTDRSIPDEPIRITPEPLAEACPLTPFPSGRSLRETAGAA